MKPIPPPPATIGDHDRQENELEVQVGVIALRTALHRFRSLPELIDPVHGSMLHSERAHTRYERSAVLVVTHRAHAMDNLRMLFAEMIDEDSNSVEAHPFAHYSLIRAAIEAAATAMWLIKNERKATRVLRALQISYRSAADDFGLIALIGERDDIREARAKRDGVVARLNELKDTLPTLRQTTLGNPPKYTEILKDVSQRTGGHGSPFAFNTPILVWKISSAFIHNSEGVIRAVSDVRQLTAFVDGVASFEVTPSMRLLGGFATVCMDLLEAVDARYLHLATHDYAGRPV